MFNVFVWWILQLKDISVFLFLSGNEVKHKYQDPGNYKVKVNAKNLVSECSETINVAVVTKITGIYLY